MLACLQAFLNDWDKVVAAAAGASLLALGYFTAKRATGTPPLPATLTTPSSSSVLEPLF